MDKDRLKEIAELRKRVEKLERYEEEVKQVRQEYLQSLEFYKNIVNSIDDPVFVKDEKHKWVYLNDAACKLWGYQKADLIGKTDYDIFPKEEADVYWEKDNKVFREEKTDVNEETQTIDGKVYVISTKKSIYKDSHTGVRYIVGTIRDVSEQKKIEAALRKSEKKYIELSITDALTGLYNTRFFYKLLKTEIERVNRYNHPLSLLILDIDDFKRHNDTYGHLEGDKVLVKLGQVIRESIRKTDSAFRYGGEEFAVLLPEATDEQAVIVAERIRKAFKAQTFTPKSGTVVGLTASIGITRYTPGEKDAAFIDRADKGMYKAKKQGKNRVVIEK